MLCGIHSASSVNSPIASTRPQRRPYRCRKIVVAVETDTRHVFGAERQTRPMQPAPCGLMIFKPLDRSCSARARRARNVTSLPARLPPAEVPACRSSPDDQNAHRYLAPKQFKNAFRSGSIIDFSNSIGQRLTWALAVRTFAFASATGIVLQQSRDVSISAKLKCHSATSLGA